MSVRAFQWKGDRLDVLDQRLLPHHAEFIRCQTPDDIARVIRDMAVRGAPAIGCCAAYGMALAIQASSPEKTSDVLNKSAALLKLARPTAVNLAWAVDRQLEKAASVKSNSRAEIFSALLEEAQELEKQDIQINQAIGKFGAALFKRDAVILTHCNTGSLATAGFGTALGVIRQVFNEGRLKKVFVDETRPYFQGTRLTAWELGQEKIPYELITDSMAAHFMKTERVDGVIVGCDRVAANGDTANKIGTYGLAVLAKHHRIPFYVAMPTSTLDLTVSTGEQIPIEERSSLEVVQVGGKQIAPEDTLARHPAFDVTPAPLISAIVTEFGVIRPPYLENFKILQRPAATPAASA